MNTLTNDEPNQTNYTYFTVKYLLDAGCKISLGILIVWCIQKNTPRTWRSNIQKTHSFLENSSDRHTITITLCISPLHSARTMAREKLRGTRSQRHDRNIPVFGTYHLLAHLQPTKNNKISNRTISQSDSLTLRN